MADFFDQGWVCVSEGVNEQRQECTKVDIDRLLSTINRIKGVLRLWELL